MTRSWPFLAVVLLICVVVALCADLIYPALRQAGPGVLLVSILGLGVGVLSLLLRLFGDRTLALAKAGLAIAALTLGAECLLLGFTLTYELSGRWPATLGTALFGFGLVPVGMVSALLKGYFIGAGSIGVFAVLFLAALAGWITARPKVRR